MERFHVNFHFLGPSGLRAVLCFERKRFVVATRCSVKQRQDSVPLILGRIVACYAMSTL